MAQPNKQGKQKNKTRRPFQMNANRLVVDSPRFIVNKFEHVWGVGVGALCRGLVLYKEAELGLCTGTSSP